MALSLDPQYVVQKETRPFVEAYGSLEGELTAVYGRDKAMSMFDWPKEAIDSDSEDYEEVVSTAIELGLTVIHRPYTKNYGRK